PPTTPNVGDRPISGALRLQLRVQYAHVGQVPVSLGEIQSVAHHETIGDLEADVADGHVDFAPIRLGQEGADLQSRRLAGLEVPHQVREGQPRIDDVLDDEDVAGLDVDVQVLEDPDDPGRVGLGPVARNRHEVDLARDRKRAHEIGHEENGALEDADQQQIPARVIGRDLLSQLDDA